MDSWRRSGCKNAKIPADEFGPGTTSTVATNIYQVATKTISLVGILLQLQTHC
jgi:hypothetical protein